MQHVFVMRCRPGIVPAAEFGTIPDLRRNTPLRYVLHRVREKYDGLGTRSALRARHDAPKIHAKLTVFPAAG